MEAERKIKYFEYFLSQILNKYPDSEKNDLSILKAQKLLFFTVATDSGVGKDNILINEVFDNFVAMPYGHVESNIYSDIRDNNLIYYSISSSKTTIIPNVSQDFSALDHRYLEVIKSAIKSLFDKNKFLIFETAFNLVELSHLYKSWKRNYHLAKTSGVNSMPIPPIEIIEEEKFYYLNQIELF
jgi:hypothetical protein